MKARLVQAVIAWLALAGPAWAQNTYPMPLATTTNPGAVIARDGNAAHFYAGDGTLGTPGGAAQVTARQDLTAVLADGSTFTLAAGSVMNQARICETAGHTVTVSLGTTSGGADVVAATVIAASTCVIVNASTFLKQMFYTSGAGVTQAIYIHSASWSSASINLSVWSDQ